MLALQFSKKNLLVVTIINFRQTRGINLKIKFLNMKYPASAILCSFMIFAIFPTKMTAQKTSGKIKYYCSSCGCSNDGKELDSAGKCSACGMHVLKLGGFNYQSPSVSNNGAMVYTFNKSGKNQQVCYKKNLFSKEKIIGEGSSPQISPDGKKIIFAGKEAENKICIYDTDAGTITNISSKIDLPGVQSPVWNSVGNGIFFCAGTFPDIGVYKINIDEGKPEPVITMEGLRYAAMPSPNGKKIAYRCAKGKTNEDRQRGIAVYDLSTKEEKYITNIGEYCTWSPDGKSLAFHWPDSSDFYIYTVKADGTGLRKIAGIKGSDSELPVWSADGRKIYFQTNRSNNWEIWSMNADGTDQKLLIRKD